RRYYVHDHLYSPVALVYPGTGAVRERYEYDAYGNCYVLEPNFAPDSDGQSNSGNPYLFTGRRVDTLDSGSLKIQYNRNRYYDYYTGRWLTRDPLEFVDSMNRYEYVKSNPATGIDPWGLYKYPFVKPPAVGDCPWKHDDTYHKDGSEPPWGPWQDGGWNVESPSVLKRIELESWWWLFRLLALGVESVSEGSLIRRISPIPDDWFKGMPDAAFLMLNFLSNTGNKAEISYHKMLRESGMAREHFGIALDVAAREAERLVTDSDTETVIVQEGHIEAHAKDSDNWERAISQYHTWGFGSVRKGKQRKSCCYYMTWTLNLRDKYEFQEASEMLWELNHYGRAKHFKTIGDVTITVNWIKGYEFREKHKDAVITGSWPIFPQCQ
ncbi:MAG: RHS repeat domain-containing protein, partial [Planctomycetota bacterium]